eukprot:1882366-Pyramimonas_sp.AAC.1
MLPGAPLPKADRLRKLKRFSMWKSESLLGSGSHVQITDARLVGGSVAPIIKEHSRNIKEHSRNIQGTFKEHSRNIKEHSRKICWCLLPSVRSGPRFLLRLFSVC